MKNKKIIIVGGGPGGLTAGMLLSSKGYDVEIFEKENKVGGRNAYIESKRFKFDVGPTFLILKPVLDRIFKISKENINDYLKFYNLDPMYNLIFKNNSLKISNNHTKTKNEIKNKFPGEEKGFLKLLKKEKKRFDVAFPCLEKDYSYFYKLFNKDLLKFIPKLSFPNSMHTELGKYFKNEDLKMSFTFQSKYLGMSPWDCPAAFMIIPYIEHNFGIYHVEGGLSEISEAMKKVILKNNGKIHLNTKVKKIEKEKIILENNKIINADKIIINADVGYAMKKLLKTKDLSKKDFSCSTFMLYLGINKKIDLDFHTVFFSDNYKNFVDKIFKDKNMTDDFSMYVRNASIIDKTIAPKGKSNIYILIPVPNNKSKINWNKIKKEFRDKIIEKFELKTKIQIKKHIITEHIITPNDWEEKYNVFLGATFNLAHSLNQMLYFRPPNKLNKNTYLVGGGTNPGSGLPTIYQSGLIVSELIENEKK
ncbi:MAG: phytoene desaturase family protein [Candidatus Woesearchaeota archaeon]